MHTLPYTQKLNIYLTSSFPKNTTAITQDTHSTYFCSLNISCICSIYSIVAYSSLSFCLCVPSLSAGLSSSSSNLLRSGGAAHAGPSWAYRCPLSMGALPAQVCHGAGAAQDNTQSCQAERPNSSPKATQTAPVQMPLRPCVSRPEARI